MKRDELLGKIFEAEFCEPHDKAEKERQLEEAFKQVCEDSGVKIYALCPAIFKVYPHYRAARLGKEMPDLPFQIRSKDLQ